MFSPAVKKKKGPSLVPRIHYPLSWDTAFVYAVSPSGMHFCYALLCSFIPILKTIPLPNLAWTLSHLGSLCHLSICDVICY